VRDWIPVSSSTKGRLAVRALEEFGRRGFEQVGVGELAAAAGVTTGSLYHHFGTKLGLYEFVRTEAERRLLDRMEGAAAARQLATPAEALRSAMLVGFDFATNQHFTLLLGEPHPGRPHDPVAQLLARIVDHGRAPIGAMLAAAWRQALLAVAAGTPIRQARDALATLTIENPAHGSSTSTMRRR
jgi:AcrR family transcriptional regulator